MNRVDTRVALQQVLLLPPLLRGLAVDLGARARDMSENRIVSSSLAGYVVALAASSVAGVLAFLLVPQLPQIPFLLSIFAVLVTAWYGGRGPGLLATVLGAAMSGYLTTPGGNSPEISYFQDLLWFGLSVLIMLLISSLNLGRKRGQEALLKLAAIVESSEDAIIGQSLDGTILTWNAGAQRIYGYTAEEAVGRPSSFLVPPERVQEISPRLDRLTGGGRLQQFETEHLRKDGRRIDVSVSISRIMQSRRKVVGFSTIARDITENKKVQVERDRLLEREQSAREQAETIAERLQVLSKQLMEAQESERRHIARELHDEIGQALTAVKINLQAAQRTIVASGPGRRQPFPIASAGEVPEGAPSETPDRVGQSLRESITLVERTLQQVRNLSLDLRPSVLDDLGLVPALRWYVDRVSQRGDLAAEFSADPLGAPLAPEIEIACFRVAQEALTNVARHARAKHARVELRQRAEAIELAIRDDGVGFDVQTAKERAAHGSSMGLLGMQERVQAAGGQFGIQSTLGRGTEIVSSFPLSKPESRQA